MKNNKRYNNFEIIPSTKSDKNSKKRKHYKMKSFFLKSFDFNYDFDYIIYDEARLSDYNYAVGFEPDVILKKYSENEAWIEIETKPLNVFYKLVNLIYIQNLNPVSWPNKLFFVTVEPKSKLNYKNTFKKISKLVEIKNICLFLINMKKKTIKKI